jgi:SAM-dependent methyltransferase
MKENDIRPESLLKRYYELSAIDAEKCFKGGVRVGIHCVACDSQSSTYQFNKNTFSYDHCDQCGTLFQSPRPEAEFFEEIYSTSESSSYWAEVFFPAVAEARREKIFNPRVDRIAEICKDKNININSIIDVGAGYGIFLEEWKKCFCNVDALAIEPSSVLSNKCREKGLTVVEEFVENVSGYDNFADLVVCFEVFEHVYSPFDFIKTLIRLTRPGGYILISSLGIDGFDLQVLGEKSNQISPPYHINFLSVQGFEQLFKRVGLTDITISTPGQLDVDIVRSAAKKNPELLNENKFLKKILNDENASDAFQKYLREQKMSSHVWVIGKKPEQKYQ